MMDNTLPCRQALVRVPCGLLAPPALWLASSPGRAAARGGEGAARKGVAAGLPSQHAGDPCRALAPVQSMMADIRRNQGRLQEAHERSKTVTRTEEMKKLREQMQARHAAHALPRGGPGCMARIRSAADCSRRTATAGMEPRLRGCCARAAGVGRPTGGAGRAALCGEPAASCV